MRLRISFARFLLQLGSFVQSLAVVVMKHDDLIEFSRQTYANPINLESWAEDGFVDSGLTANELDLLSEVPTTTGNLLLLGVGGGREAIPLARKGFRVTGVDFVAALVARAKENASRRGVQIEGLVQEISRLDVPGNTYDVVWLSREMYSCVPTRMRREAMVRRIKNSLKPGGFFLCQFHFDPRSRLSKKGIFVRRLIAACSLGNLAYEEGDILWYNIEFVHTFSSEDEVRLELEESRISVITIKSDPNTARAAAICRKLPESN